MFLKLNTMNFVIVLLTFITMTYGYSLSYMPNFNMKNTFDRIDNNKKNLFSGLDDNDIEECIRLIEHNKVGKDPINNKNNKTILYIT